jgi:hypothetical protein
MRLTLTLLALLGLLATTAHADHRRYTRKPDLHIDVKRSPSAAPAHPAPKPARPAVDADDILAIEEANQPIRREQEKVLEGLVRDTPDDDPQKPDLMFRLAEQYARQLRFWKLKAIEATITRP